MQAETELRKDWQASGTERDWTWLEHLKPQSFSAPCATLPPTRLFLLNPCQEVAFPNSQASRYTSLWGHPYSNYHSVHCFSGLRSKMKVTVSRALRFPTLCFYSSVCFVVVVSTIIYSDPGFSLFHLLPDLPPPPHIFVLCLLRKQANKPARMKQTNKNENPKRQRKSMGKTHIQIYKIRNHNILTKDQKS